VGREGLTKAKFWNQPFFLAGEVYEFTEVYEEMRRAIALPEKKYSKIE